MALVIVCSLGACSSPGDDSALCDWPPRDVGWSWVLVAPGQFPMSVTTPRHVCDELGDGPIQLVRLTRPIAVSRYETTRYQWEELLPLPSPLPLECQRPDCPVFANDPSAILRLANALSQREGLARCYELWECPAAYGSGEIATCAELVPEGLDCEGYRLPTEAEWEYFARAGNLWDGPCSNREQYCDDEGPRLEEVAWCDYQPGCPEDENGNGPVSFPVGLKLANAWGGHDVLGNVPEAVWGRSSTLYRGGFVTDPVGDVSPEAPVSFCRGAQPPGGTNPWSLPSPWCGAATYYFPFRIGTGRVGFRLVRTLTPEEAERWARERPGEIGYWPGGSGDEGIDWIEECFGDGSGQGSGE